MQNPIEIYKRLPKTNCGDCPQKTCMAFGLALLKGEASVDDCPHLQSDSREELSRIKPTDWRLDLIESLKGEIRQLNIKEIAPSIGAAVRDDSIIIKCLGTEYTITPEGDIETEGHINPWIKILLLHYIRTRGQGEPTGRWVSFSELKSGMVKAQSFERECEIPLMEALNDDFNHVDRLLTMLGAKRVEHEPAEYAWLFYPLPKIPVLILYWSGEEPALKVLFDSIVDRFLDVESLIFLMEGLIHIIRQSKIQHR